MEKNIKFVVLKMDDLLAIGAKDESFGAAMRFILDTYEEHRSVNGKNPSPQYLVCNEDEPYAEIVLDVILRGKRLRPEKYRM